MDNKSTPKKLKMLITVVDRGRGEKHTELYRKNNVMYNMILLGKGTAKSEILDYLGIGRTDKDIIISVGEEDSIQNIMKILKEEMYLNEPGNGIAFTTSISSVDSSLALEYINHLFEGRKE